ncbi:hypothetical protein A2U01_0011975 [Trifolium medium]|uniref:Uncharacterized protein n=1 Tax=Trifolium medium TaxID=97028 RepID=A0A392MU99_9FABA|nr:hypothetical protein [Trifolium medium]
MNYFFNNMLNTSSPLALALCFRWLKMAKDRALHLLCFLNQFLYCFIRHWGNLCPAPCSFVHHRESDGKHRTVLIDGSCMVVGRHRIRIQTR